MSRTMKAEVGVATLSSPHDEWLARGASSKLKKYATSAATGRGPLLLWRQATLIVVLVVGALLFASSPSGSSTYAFVLSVTYAIVILGGNVVTGFLEEVNLAQGGLMAIGAYVATYVETRHVELLIALLVGVLATAVVGAALACAVVRLTGVYTALLTFSLSYAVPDLLLYAAKYTGGGNGIGTPVDVKLFGASIGGTSPATIWLVVVAFLLCGAAFLLVGYGRPGRVMHASKKRAFAASTFGVNPRWIKWMTWVASSALCGLGGALYALVVGFIVPGQFTLTLSLYLLVGTLAGGARTAIGALIGGGLVGALPIMLSGNAGGTEPLLLGALLLIVILLGGSGIWTRVEEGAVWLVGTVFNRKALSDAAQASVANPAQGAREQS